VSLPSATTTTTTTTTTASFTRPTSTTTTIATTTSTTRPASSVQRPHTLLLQLQQQLQQVLLGSTTTTTTTSTTRPTSSVQCPCPLLLQLRRQQQLQQVLLGSTTTTTTTSTTRPTSSVQCPHLEEFERCDETIIDCLTYWWRWTAWSTCLLPDSVPGASVAGPLATPCGLGRRFRYAECVRSDGEVVAERSCRQHLPVRNVTFSLCVALSWR